jgi:hypothetical protein
LRLWSYIAIAILASTGVAQAQQKWLLTSTPVSVEAERLDDLEGVYRFRIDVQGGESVRTAILAREQASAVASLHEAFAWKPPYLLVRTECGGGNRHDCYRESVFKVSGTQVVRLGQLVADERSPTGSVLKQGNRFVDAYEQSVAELCHACWPSFRVELEESGGRFAVLAKETWDANREQWGADSAFLLQHPRTAWSPGDEQLFLVRLVRAAVLAKYCGRERELENLLQTAAPALDVDRRQVLAGALEKVMPLQPPATGRVDL